MMAKSLWKVAKPKCWYEQNFESKFNYSLVDLYV